MQTYVAPLQINCFYYDGTPRYCSIHPPPPPRKMSPPPEIVVPPKSLKVSFHTIFQHLERGGGGGGGGPTMVPDNVSVMKWTLVSKNKSGARYIHTTHTYHAYIPRSGWFYSISKTGYFFILEPGHPGDNNIRLHETYNNNFTNYS